MKRDTARSIVTTVLRYSDILNRSIAEREGDRAYHRLTGNLMGYLFTNLLMPIFSQYPDMESGFAGEGEQYLLAREHVPEVSVDYLALADSLSKELSSIRMFIQEDETIQEKEWALSDLNEISEHLDAFSAFVKGLQD